MRVLHVTNMYPTEERPGLGIFIKSRIDSLSARGVENDVVEVRGYESRWKYLEARRTFGSALCKKSYDIVHVHYGLTALATYGVPSPPTVISYCGSDLLHPAQRPISKFLARSARHHIVESERLKRILGRPEAAVIPSGVDLGIFLPLNRAEARSRLRIDHDRPIVLFVANPGNPIKNFHLANAVIERAREFVPAIEFMVVQGKTQSEVAVYMNAADALLLTSRWEGSPNVIKEALACGLPVVSRDVGDVRERLQDVSHSYVEETRDALAARIAELTQTPVRSDGPSHVSQLSLERIAERLELFYKVMLSSQT